MGRVTPLAGVWIEIFWLMLQMLQQLSLPLRECGLKYYCVNKKDWRCVVTPLAGVWSEIEYRKVD